MESYWLLCCFSTIYKCMCLSDKLLLIYKGQNICLLRLNNHNIWLYEGDWLTHISCAVFMTQSIKSPLISTWNVMVSLFVLQLYVPLWRNSAVCTESVLIASSFTVTIPSWGSTSFPSLYHQTCALGSETSHCSLKGLPDSMHLVRWASGTLENVTGGATDNFVQTHLLLYCLLPFYKTYILYL